MKISAEFVNGYARVAIPTISYDMSAKEYDYELLAMASAIVASCAQNISKGDDELMDTTFNAIIDCAKAFATCDGKGDR